MLIDGTDRAKASYMSRLRVGLHIKTDSVFETNGYRMTNIQANALSKKAREQHDRLAEPLPTVKRLVDVSEDPAG